MNGDKFDEGKIMVDLIPSEPIEALATILTHGANKYAPNNWQKGVSFRKIYASKERHRLAYRRGEYIDQESGYPHLWHEFCNLAFLIYQNHPDNYARYEKFNDFKEEWAEKLQNRECETCVHLLVKGYKPPCNTCAGIVGLPNWKLERRKEVKNGE